MPGEFISPAQIKGWVPKPAGRFGNEIRRYRIIVTQFPVGVNADGGKHAGFWWFFCGKLLHRPQGMQYN